VAWNSYRFRLEAVDGGEPKRSGSVDVFVTITDVNDHSPTFGSASMEARVREDSVVGTVICRPTATDADQGLNAELRYRFTAETRRQHGATFHIRPATGAVVLAGELDYETRRDYTLYVTASDRSGSSADDDDDDDDRSALTAMISIVVLVEDVNDHAPDIAFNFRRPSSDNRHHQSNFAVRDQPFPVVTIDRAARVGSFVAHVTVRDADDGDNGRFRCVLLSSAGNRDETGNRFALRQMYDTEYTIVTKAPVDDLPTTRNAVTLSVYCADGGRPALTSEASLVVTVGDPTTLMDENIPSDFLSKKVITIALSEDVPIGTAIYCPRPSDGDRNSVIRSIYQITDVLSSAGSALRFLAVDATSGVVSTKLTLDRRHHCRMVIDLWKNGDENRSRRPVVRLSVVVVNATQRHHLYSVTAPSDVEFSVVENSLGGTYVGSVSRASELCLPTSDDAGDKVTYELVGDDSSTLSKLFQIGPGSGRLTTLGPLDRELRLEYSLLVLSRVITKVIYVDASGCQSSAARRTAVFEALARLRVTVTDVNDNSPAFEFPRPGNDVTTVPRRAASGHVVSRVIAHDNDAGHNAAISYRIQSSSAWSKAFSIDRTTGISHRHRRCRNIRIYYLDD